MSEQTMIDVPQDGAGELEANGSVEDMQPEPATQEEPAEKPRDYEAEIAKLRKENANWRTKYREAEPIIKQHKEWEEANKTELQRAQEALESERQARAEMEIGYSRLELAAMYNIPPDSIDLIGSGSREEMEDRAARLGALVSSDAKKPPTDRPVEGLRPGASPEPPKPEDNSYPANWGFQRRET